MDSDKAIAVSEFIQSKETSLGREFMVKLEIQNATNYGSPLSTGLIIENNFSKDDFTFVFMDNIVKYYLGHVQMDMNYLSDMKFDGKYLCFSTDSKKVRLS